MLTGRLQFAGAGKTYIGCLLILAMLDSLGKMYGSAPTNFAVNNMANRLHQMSLDIAEKATQYERYGVKFSSGHTPVTDELEELLAFISGCNAVGQRRPLIVRGFNLDDEVKVAMMLLQNPDLAENMDLLRVTLGKQSGKWQFHLTLAFWFLLSIGHHRACKSEDRPDGKLQPTDPLRLHVFKHRQINLDIRMQPFLQLGAGQLDWAGLLRQVAKPADLVKEAMECFFKHGYVDIVFTTPALSGSQPYAGFRGRVAAVVLDETGNMHRSDFHAVRGNTLLPTLLMGDEKQLPPFVAAPKMKTEEKFAVNRHWFDCAMSVLRFLKSNGIPVFRLNKQNRMANGLFDYALGIFYSDIKASGSFGYGPGCNIDLPKFEAGRLLEEYLQDRFPKLKAPPPGKLQPVYLHYPGRAFVNHLNGSKSNRWQIRAVLALLVDFVNKTGVNPKKIGLLTPYRRNMETLDSFLKRSKYAKLKEGIEGSRTVDSFQGQEHDIIVYLTVSERSKGFFGGPGFVANENRLNVAITRQVSGLVIVGDINVAVPIVDDIGSMSWSDSKLRKKVKGAKQVKVTNYEDDGSISYSPVGKLLELHKAMLIDGRVVALDDPEEPQVKEKEEDTGKGKGKEVEKSKDDVGKED